MKEKTEVDNKLVASKWECSWRLCLLRWSLQPRNYKKSARKRAAEQNNDVHNGNSLLKSSVRESVTKREENNEQNYATR